jgi:hypothetical protein
MAFDPADRLLFVADPHDFLAQLDLSGGLLRWTATPTEAGKQAIVAAGRDGTAFLALTAGLWRLTAGSTLAARVVDAPPNLRALAVVRQDRVAVEDSSGRIFFFNGTTWIQEVDTLAMGSRLPFLIDGDDSIFIALSSTDLWIRDPSGRWSLTGTDQEYFSGAVVGGGRYILLGRGDASWWNGSLHCSVQAGNGRALNEVSVDPSRRWAAAVAGTDSTHTRSEIVGLALPGP